MFNLNPSNLGFEGMTENQCPFAKWIIRRTDNKEKVLVLFKQRYVCMYTAMTSLPYLNF